MWGEVQKQPLNYAVWPYLAGDLTFAAQAMGEHKMARALPKSDPFKSYAMALPAISAFVTAASLTGDILTGFSSKKVSSEPDARDASREKLVKFAAGILAKQPPETQKFLIDKTAEYLAKQQGLRMVDLDKEELSARILKHTQNYASAAVLGR